jgi:rod shape-determining protein MreC
MVGKVAQTVVTLFQKPFAAMADTFGSATGGILTDKKLLTENELLKEQVSELENQLIQARLDGDELKELPQRASALDSTDLSSDYNLKAANVMSFDGSSGRMFNIFTIDCGTESGVKRNTVVVNGDGLIGRVIEADKGWAKVVSIIDENNNVGFQVASNLDYLGVCRGDGKGNMVGNLLDEEGTVKEGDQIITSGIGGVYPSGIVIGIVSKAERTAESPFMSVTIKTDVYFKGLKKVAALV